MGRTLSINNVDAQTFQVLAGEQINENDVVQMGHDGKGYRVQGTNTAAVSNCTYGTAQTDADTGQIVAHTQVAASQTQVRSRQAVLQGDDGSIFTFTRASGNGQLLSKYSASGALMGSVTLADALSNNRYSNHHIFRLSNGNICVVAGGGTSGNDTAFAIFTQNLSQVVGLTAVPEAAVTYTLFSACAMSGGGFAIVYQQNSNPLLSSLVTYDNSGNEVLAPTTIWTRTGTSGMQFHRMAQLSDGNLVVTIGSANTGSSIGLFHGVVSTSGGSVLPFVNLDTTAVTTLHELSVMDGYYAVCAYCGTQQKAFVFADSGTLQGSPFSAAGAGGSPAIKLLNDGSNFFMIWPRNLDSKEVLTKIPVTGTGYITTDVTLAGTSQFNTRIDAFCERGLIVAVSQAATAADATPVLWVIDTSNGNLISKSGTSFGVAPGTYSGSYHRVIPGGDFSFVCLYDYANTTSTNLYIGKYANTAIMGVAKTSGAAGQLVSVTGESGGHAINKLAGTASVAFDHSAATTIGNKGTLMNHGVTLKGI